MNYIIIISVFFIIIYILNYNKFSEQYSHITPEKADCKDMKYMCKRKALLNGICYPNMETCAKECPKYSPFGLKHSNYCIDYYDGEAVCYPSTW